MFMSSVFAMKSVGPGLQHALVRLRLRVRVRVRP
jgi:hypothetical protein